MRPRAFLIVGPTASGKTTTAIEICKRLSVPLVNADSVQIYRHFNLGTAKPTKAELLGIKHFLFDVAEPHESYTAAQFRDSARALFEVETNAVLVGGSGFYLRAFESGMYDVPPVSQELRAEIDLELKARGPLAMYTEIQKIDPLYAEKISSQDAYRIGRALALMRATGKTMSQIRQETHQNLDSRRWSGHIKKIGLKVNREKLAKRVLERTRNMLADGLVEEVRDLIARFGDSLPALNSIGYREVCMFLRNEIAYEVLSSLITSNTLHLAKRQMTWFRKDLTIEWLDIESQKDQIIERAATFFKEFANG